MLGFLGYNSLDAFIDDCVPAEIRLEADALTEQGPNGIRALSESELLRRAKEIGKKNQVKRSFIGMGYHQAVRSDSTHGIKDVLLTGLRLQVLPQVILRNMLENHGWFSQYSPYQAEISQGAPVSTLAVFPHRTDEVVSSSGRLESLINFQTITTSLTGLDIANASLLDEGTAAAEAMIMAYGQLREKRKTIFVDRSVLPQTVAVVKTRAEPFGINVVVGNVRKLLSDENGDVAQHKDLIGCILQVRLCGRPGTNGQTDYSVCSTRTFAAKSPIGRVSRSGLTTSAATSCARLTSSRSRSSSRPASGAPTSRSVTRRASVFRSGTAARTLRSSLARTSSSGACPVA